MTLVLDRPSVNVPLVVIGPPEDVTSPSLVTATLVTVPPPPPPPVAERVPPVYVRPVPTTTEENPPEPLPLRMSLPVVAGAKNVVDCNAALPSPVT